MSTPPALSPRRRRLRLTFRLLALVAVIGSVVGWIAHRFHRTAEYRPGEASADVTSELARSLPAEAPRPRFTDLTATAGLGEFRTFAGPRSSQLPEDNGPGVPPEIRDRLFFPLVRGREGGTGLGLHLAQTIVQAHQGTIDCDSQPGRTDFCLTIPLP